MSEDLPTTPSAEAPAAPAHSEAHAFATFVLSGGVAALVNLAARWTLSHWIIFEAAVTLAHLFGMVTAFTLTRYFVFSGARGVWRAQLTRFALVNVVTFFQILLISGLLVRIVFPAIGWRWHPEEIGHLAGVMSPVVTSYYAHKHFSFGAGERRT